ncbi:MAG: tRNA (adenosine(37)-N6)-dimethylallyltransferase MiaA [Gammaproteobacteria bacterium]|nr:tRNA (adenosine(37)-N6)-dimethylallyltransferase MiaA [Gammaproteobacteria bacterium]
MTAVLKLPVISLMGPTAIGKTDLAIRLYQALKAQNIVIDIISVDSAMVYRGLNIGSGKPEQEILANIPHGLVDIREPYDVFSVADFCQQALELIKISHDNNRVPLLVGGTIMYFNALQHGLAKLPSCDPLIRKTLEEQINHNGLNSLYSNLQEIDNKSAQKINPNDKQRIVRALEVYLTTGKPLSELLLNNTVNTFTGLNNINIMVAPDDRSWLHNNIATRFHQMLDNGFIAEVESLLANSKITDDLPAIKACGYKQVWQYLLGETDRETMIERSIIATRQLAKRQLTWLRSCLQKWDNVTWLNAIDDCLVSKISTKIIKILNF